MFCQSCGTANQEAARFCQSCGRPVTGAPAVPNAPASAAAYTPPYVSQPDPRMRIDYPPSGMAARRYAAGRSPFLAFVLSGLIVGVGQFYNGDVKKGLLMFFIAFVCGLATILLAGIGWWVVAIWSAIDAYQVASGKSPLW